MNVWIIQTGEPLHSDGANARPMRAMNLANKLIQLGHSVTIISSAFYHQEKVHRSAIPSEIFISDCLKIALVPSPGYVRNVGIGRLYDHFILAINLRRTLIKLWNKPPNVVFVGYPPIETSYVAAKLLSKKNIPYYLDVKDQWPSLFLDALPKSLRLAGKLVLYPYFYMARFVMRNASGAGGMSLSYLNWIYKFSKREPTDFDGHFPLTSPIDALSADDLLDAECWWNANGVPQCESVFRIVFIGSHMSVFDFEPIRAAATKFQSQMAQVEFIICGDGAYGPEIKKLLAGLHNVKFPGWIDRPRIQVLAARSNAAIMPYKNIDNYIDNIPNKIIDALSLGLPILCPLDGEVDHLISSRGVGLKYSTSDEDGLYNCISRLLSDPDLCRTISDNESIVYNECFEFHKVYSDFANLLIKIGGR